MLDNELLDQIEVSDEEINQELAAAFDGKSSEAELANAINAAVGVFKPDSVLKGRIVDKIGNEVVVDVGLKSEGYVPISEWDDKSEIDIGDEIEVLLEQIESDTGVVLLSKRKADRIRGWERIMATCHEGDRVSGKCIRKIKGGLLVDIGVPVFLPASQIDIRRPPDVDRYLGQTIDAMVLKIDQDRRNIVISRRKLIEADRAEAKAKVLETIEEGQIVEGVVKNIADFGAFVDLGGIDGLLHITDMSWDRVSSPHDIVKVDQKIKIKILNVDREKEKIALGLKQTQVNPWEEVEQRFPIGSRVTGNVVNLVNYGAFVKLDGGIEGLVHISEMSWTRRITHPSEILKPGDEIEIIVLAINKNKQEISLGLKQTETNPWTQVAEKYPPNTVVTGTVRNLTNYGAFVEIEAGIDGLLHVSDMSWTKKVSHPSELLNKSEQIKCVVLTVDQDKQRIALGLKQLAEDPWLHAVPERYIPGMIVKGRVTKITNFGVFVELEQDLEGLLHVSELSDEKISDPHDVVQLEQEIEVKILRVDAADRKIGLSKKRADWAADSTAPPGESGAELSARKQRRGGLHGAGEATTDIISGTALLHKDGAADKTANESSEPEGKTAEENTPGDKTAENDDNPAEEQVAGDEEKTAES
ncbi:MAG: 30S ribosomal protein S1 [Planctomycetota bacterium]|nr:30S ribosomal protein S1 [Planctomycetota bacterium]